MIAGSLQAEPQVSCMLDVKKICFGYLSLNGHTVAEVEAGCAKYQGITFLKGLCPAENAVHTCRLVNHGIDFEVKYYADTWDQISALRHCAEVLPAIGGK